MALNHGPYGTECLQALYWKLTISERCGTSFHGPYFHHFTMAYTHLFNPEQIISSLYAQNLTFLFLTLYWTVDQVGPCSTYVEEDPEEIDNITI